MTEAGEVTQILNAIGERQRDKPGQTLQATALVHEAYLRLAQTRTKAGLAFVGDLHKAEAGLIEAKIQRERSRKNQSELVSLLKQLVQVREKELASVQALHRGGKTTQSDLQATIKSLLEAQAALEQASAGK